MGMGKLPNYMVVGLTKVPPTLCFIWTATWGEDLTIDNLQRNKMHPPTGVKYLHMKNQPIICYTNGRLQNRYGCIWKQLGVVTNHVELISKKSNNRLTRVEKLLRVGPYHAIAWSLWRERNNRIFSNKFQSDYHIVNCLKLLLWKWTANEQKCKGVFFSDDVIFNWKSIVRDTFVQGRLLN